MPAGTGVVSFTDSEKIITLIVGSQVIFCTSYDESRTNTRSKRLNTKHL